MEASSQVPGRQYQALASIPAPSEPFFLHSKGPREVGVADRVGKGLIWKEVAAGFLNPQKFLVISGDSLCV